MRLYESPELEACDRIVDRLNEMSDIDIFSDQFEIEHVGHGVDAYEMTKDPFEIGFNLAWFVDAKTLADAYVYNFEAVALSVEKIVQLFGFQWWIEPKSPGLASVRTWKAAKQVSL